MFSNVHREERRLVIEAAAARHSHWGTSEELNSEGKSQLYTCSKLKEHKSLIVTFLFPIPNCGGIKKVGQTAGGREQEMCKPGI